MPEQTLKRLLDGNQRFVENKLTLDVSESRRKAVALEQNPFAIILGCVDSRVPAELIFDQGLGELFVIRTAGQVLDRSILGSVEFGVIELHIPLVVVLGHKYCGALKAAMGMVRHHNKPVANMSYLVEELALAVEIGNRIEGDHLDQAIRAQIISVVVQLRKLPALKAAIDQGNLGVVGGYYDLDTGLVDIIVE